jgi:hypothetical protein
LTWEGGDLSADLKRLQEYFHDDRIKLWYNRVTKQFEVWYEAPNLEYCVAVYKRYEFGKIVHDLSRRQLSARDLKLQYLKTMEKLEQVSEKKSAEVHRAFGEGLNKIARQRTTSSPPLRR